MRTLTTVLSAWFITSAVFALIIGQLLRIGSGRKEDSDE